MALKINFRDDEGVWESVEIPPDFKVSTLQNKDIRIYHKGEGLNDLALSDLQWSAFSEYARTTFTKLVESKDSLEAYLQLCYEADGATAEVEK